MGSTVVRAKLPVCGHELGREDRSREAGTGGQAGRQGREGGCCFHQGIEAESPRAQDPVEASCVACIQDVLRPGEPGTRMADPRCHKASTRLVPPSMLAVTRCAEVVRLGSFAVPGLMLVPHSGRAEGARRELPLLQVGDHLAC